MSSIRKKRRGKHSRRLNADLFESDSEDDKAPREVITPETQWRELLYRKYLRMRMREGLRAKPSVWVDEQGRPVSLAERIVRLKLEKQGKPADIGSKIVDLSPDDRSRREGLRKLLDQYRTLRESEHSLSAQLLGEIENSKLALHDDNNLQTFTVAKASGSNSTLSLGDSATHYNAKVKVMEAHGFSPSDLYFKELVCEDLPGPCLDDISTTESIADHRKSPSYQTVKDGTVGEPDLNSASTSKGGESRMRETFKRNDIPGYGLQQGDADYAPINDSNSLSSRCPKCEHYLDHNFDTEANRHQSFNNAFVPRKKRMQEEVIRGKLEAKFNDDRAKNIAKKITSTTTLVDKTGYEHMRTTLGLNYTGNHSHISTGEIAVNLEKHNNVDNKQETEFSHSGYTRKNRTSVPLVSHIEKGTSQPGAQEYIPGSSLDMDRVICNYDHNMKDSQAQHARSTVTARENQLKDNASENPFGTCGESDENDTLGVSSTIGANISSKTKVPSISDHRIYKFLDFTNERSYSLPEFISIDLSTLAVHSSHLFNPCRGASITQGSFKTTTTANKRSEHFKLDKDEHGLDSDGIKLSPIDQSRGEKGERRMTQRHHDQTQVETLPSIHVVTPSSSSYAQDVGEVVPLPLIPPGVTHQLHRGQYRSSTTVSATPSFNNHQGLGETRGPRILGLYNELQSYGAYYQGPSDVSMALFQGHHRLDARIEWGFPHPRTPHHRSHFAKPLLQPPRRNVSSKVVEALHNKEPPSESGEVLQTVRANSTRAFESHGVLPLIGSTRRAKKHDFIYQRDYSFSRFVQMAGSEDTMTQFLKPTQEEDIDCSKKPCTQRKRHGNSKKLPRVATFSSKPRTHAKITARHRKCFEDASNWSLSKRLPFAFRPAPNPSHL